MGRNASTDHINEEMRKFSSSEKLLSLADVEQRLQVNKLTCYVEADAFIGNPYALLGQVIVVRKLKDGPCSNDMFSPDSQAEFSIAPVIGGTEIQSARLNAPVQRSSILVNRELSLTIGFLTFLSGQLQEKDNLSLVVFDEAAGLLNTKDRSWIEAVNAWKKENQDVMHDPSVCYVFAVTGFIQKNIIKKKFTEFKAGASAGAYGINVEGKLYTSTEDFSLDIRFGLTPGIIKRPAPPSLAKAITESRTIMAESPTEITEQEKLMFASLTRVKALKV